MNSDEELFLISTIYEVIENLPEEYDPEAFLHDNINELLTSERIEYVYNEILSLCEEEADVEANKVIDCLCYTYLVANHNKKSLVTKYLQNTDKEDVYRLFRENSSFAENLLREYFSYIGRREELKNQEEIIKTEDPEYLTMKYAYNIKIEFVTTYLRNNYLDLVQSFISAGYGMPEALQTISILLRKDTQAIGDEELVDIINTLKQYRPFLIRLMFADIYTCLVSTNLYDQDMIDYMVLCYVDYCVENEIYELPENEELREALFAFFLYIACDDELRKELESKVSKEDLLVLKRINPYYGIE